MNAVVEGLPFSSLIRTDTKWSLLGSHSVELFPQDTGKCAHSRELVISYELFRNFRLMKETRTLLHAHNNTGPING